MKLRPINLLLLIATGVTLIACSPSYESIANRDSRYYRELAQAFDKVLLETPDNQINKEFNLNVLARESSLPPAIRSLHPTSTKVWRVIGVDQSGETNFYPGVLINIGYPRTGFGISWQPEDGCLHSNCFWELSISDGGPRKIVYSTKELFWRTNNLDFKK